MFSISCRQEESINLKEDYLNSVKFNNDRISFNSKETLNNFLKNAKKEDYTTFKDKMIEKSKDNNFKSLMPLFEEHQSDKLNEFIEFKKTENTHFAQNSRGSSEEPEIDLDYDEIIGDPYFATLLNRKREITVDGTVYKFTESGLFLTNESNYSNLEPVIQSVSPCEMLTSEPGLRYVDQDVYAYVVQPIDDCGGSGGYGGGCSTCTPPPSLTREEIRDNLKVCEYHENILNKVFGPSEKCFDYFSDDRRIKVKAWAQNYYIYASTGVSTTSQERFLGVWWRDKIDEIELGYSIATFEYPVSIKWPELGTKFRYEYGDYIVNEFGQFVSYQHNHPKSLFEKFPISDPNKKLIVIYLNEDIRKILGFEDTENYKTLLTAKEFNNGVQKITKDAFKTLSSKLNKTFNDNSAVIVYPSLNNDKIYFLYTNWNEIRNNENRISEVFDWNTAQIGFSTSGVGGTNQNTKPVFDVATSYKNVNIVCYGMGRRGSVWKGGKVVLTDAK